MIRVFAALALVLAVPAAFASTDFKCMSDCTRQGYQYGYCQKICSY